MLPTNVSSLARWVIGWLPCRLNDVGLRGCNMLSLIGLMGVRWQAARWRSSFAIEPHGSIGMAEWFIRLAVEHRRTYRGVVEKVFENIELAIWNGLGAGAGL